MTKDIPEAQLSLISELVARRFGLHFPPERWPDLKRGVCAAAEECGSHGGLENYIEALQSSAVTENHISVLASHLTIGETYFFRENRSLEILGEHIVPELLSTRSRTGRQIRIWSAGCATGEEPYSVAMVLSKLISGRRDWSVEILATDINARSLGKASEGIYTDWSFRGTPPWVRRSYFEAAQDGRWVIVPAIKKMVSFAPFNMMDETYPPLSNGTNRFDAIFCRNVLMYFTPEGMRKVIRQLHRYLAPDGWLIVSPTETSHELFSEFATVSFGDATLYRKSDKPLPVASALPVGGEPSLSVQQPEWIAGAMKPFAASICPANRETEDTRPVPVSVEPPTASYAQSIQEQRRHTEAGRTMDAVLSQNGNDAQAMLLQAQLHANQGKLDDALAWCDKAIAADKMAARAHYLRAMILQEQESIPEAILALQKALYADPQFLLVHFALGNLALKDGRRKESGKHFENVLLLLARYQPEDIVPESEGLSAGRLREMIVAPATPGSRPPNRPLAWRSRPERVELGRR